MTLGASAVPLYGPWKFSVGDSPVDPATGRAVWAEPEFDDGQWESVDMTPADGSFDPGSGVSGYTPGWTAKGHPGYWGYAWYRIRLRVDAPANQSLALAGPPDCDDAYQVFENGRLLGSFGDFSTRKPTVYYTQPRLFGLAAAGFASGTAAAPVRVLAFRFWMEPNTGTLQADAGGMKTAPVLGEADAVTNTYRLRWQELILTYGFHPLLAVVCGLLAVLALSLILFDRTDPVYLWMSALFLLLAATHALLPGVAWTSTSADAGIFVQSYLLIPLSYACGVIVWWVWFGRPRPVWLPYLVAALTVILILSSALGENLFTFVPGGLTTAMKLTSQGVRFLLFALTIRVVIQGMRGQPAEGWLVLPAAILRGFSLFAPELRLLRVQVDWHIFGVYISLVQFADLAFAVAVSLLLLRRMLRSVRRQREMALDVKQAQEVQQVILPEMRVEFPGLVIESEYRPSLEVGGDFFQIVPHPSDGSLLVVAGDVAGKGLKAGMMVALLVGAIRTAARFTFEPEEILQELNLRLLGRGDARATCLALTIAASGTVNLANAGHLPPYRNGRPIELDGSLPLGMLESPGFTHAQLALIPGDRLTLVSDGIAEAAGPDGELFGFERTESLLERARSAAEIADAAQAFGQQDDISVIAITRLPAA